MEKVLLYLSLKYEGDFKKIYQAIINKEEIDEEFLEKNMKKIKCHYTTIISSDYPEALKHINCPPFVLYYYGDLSLVDKKTIGVIGTSNPSQYGRDVAHTFTKDLIENNYVIINGFSLGTDEITTNQILESKGKNIVVLPRGIEYSYPKRDKKLYNELKNNHLIISEYPFETKPQKIHYCARDRLIAGLSSLLLVTETKIKSSNMLIVGYALEQEKEVMCVPSNIFGNQGCNILIEQGAHLVKNVNDIIEQIR